MNIVLNMRALFLEKINMSQFWTDPEEQRFLMSYIKPNHSMLEYGSGHSTLILQDKVEQLVSVEHHKEWYDKIKPQLKKSVKYIYVPPNNLHWEAQFEQCGAGQFRKNSKGDDGSFEDFADYILAPLRGKHGPFDVIFIDGRARACCAFAAMFMLKPSGRIFIHDFGPEYKHPFLGHRTYYDLVFNFLKEKGHSKTMYCFQIQKSINKFLLRR